MKIKSQRTSHKKKIYLGIIAVVAIILLSTWLAHHYQFWPFQPDNSATQNNKDVQNNSDATNNQTKEKSAEKSVNVDNTKNTSEIPVSTETTVQITQLAQDSRNVTYSASIANPGSSGTCSAVFTNDNSRPVTNEIPSTNGTCGPVSIPVESFTSLGQWTLTLRYYTNNTQAVATKTIEIK